MTLCPNILQELADILYRAAEEGSHVDPVVFWID